MSYCPEPDSHIREKVKVVLDQSKYTTKKELDHATGVDTSDLAAKKDFTALKAEVDKLDIAKLVNILTSLNNLKTKVDDLDVGKNTKFNTLKIKVNNFGNKIIDTTTLVHINQYHTDKQNLGKKIGDTDKKIPDTSGLMTATILKT